MCVKRQFISISGWCHTQKKTQAVQYTARHFCDTQDLLPSRAVWETLPQGNVQKCTIKKACYNVVFNTIFSNTYYIQWYNTHYYYYFLVQYPCALCCFPSGTVKRKAGSCYGCVQASSLLATCFYPTSRGFYSPRNTIHWLWTVCRDCRKLSGNSTQ